MGLGHGWNCVFSNEWCAKKAQAYRSNFGSNGLRVCDIANLAPKDLPGTPDLVWASFPCQDLSLAGNGAGLAGERSGTFRTFWRLMQKLKAEQRAPRTIVLENVVGTLTSHGGDDFREIVSSLVSGEYRVGALVLDAIHFVPQSRPRLFFVAVQKNSSLAQSVIGLSPSGTWQNGSLRSIVARLPESLREQWIWWNLPSPPTRVRTLSEVIEENPAGVRWHTHAETQRLLEMMTPSHLKKIEQAKNLPGRVVGTVYRRTRPNPDGTRSQRAEVRIDGVAGCLRTPTGGSSRQTLVVIEGGLVRSRLLSSREAARLMGVPDDYSIPENYNDAYHLFGDGLVVPVVRWLSSSLLLPLCSSNLRAAA